jgi:hypothetical protein
LLAVRDIGGTRRVRAWERGIAGWWTLRFLLYSIPLIVLAVLLAALLEGKLRVPPSGLALSLASLAALASLWFAQLHKPSAAIRPIVLGRSELIEGFGRRARENAELVRLIQQTVAYAKGRLRGWEIYGPSGMVARRFIGFQSRGPDRWYLLDREVFFDIVAYAFHLWVRYQERADRSGKRATSGWRLHLDLIREGVPPPIALATEVALLNVIATHARKDPGLKTPLEYAGRPSDNSSGSAKTRRPKRR